MTTFAEDMRTVLAEVAPNLAVRLVEPKTSWGRYAIKGPLVDEATYKVVYRARLIVCKQRGSTAACFECCRAWYLSQSPSECTHMVHA